MVAGTRVVMMGLGVDLRDIKDLGLGHHAWWGRGSRLPGFCAWVSGAKFPWDAGPGTRECLVESGECGSHQGALEVSGISGWHSGPQVGDLPGGRRVRDTHEELLGRGDWCLWLRHSGRLCGLKRGFWGPGVWSLLASESWVYLGDWSGGGRGDETEPTWATLCTLT